MYRRPWQQEHQQLVGRSTTAGGTLITYPYTAAHHGIDGLISNGDGGVLVSVPPPPQVRVSGANKVYPGCDLPVYAVKAQEEWGDSGLRR